MHKLTHLSLCSGIGGIDLAAERAGFQTVGQCEIDEYASKVLAKNFKGVPNLHDIRTVSNRRLREFGIPTGNELTVLSAGFPCQPYSLAGKGLGDSDSRDLWGEVARVIGEVLPKWFVCENTPGLFSRENQRYFSRILDDLSALGYSVGWGIWGACDVGAPHKRNRVFFICRNADLCRDEKKFEIPRRENAKFSGVCREVSHSPSERRNSSEIQRREPSASRRTKNARRIQAGGLQSVGICGGVPNAYGFGLEKQIEEVAGRGNNHGYGAKTNDSGKWWEIEPDVGRVAHGISFRVDRLRCLGNAVVPEQAFPIFEAIAEVERSKYDDETNINIR